MEKLAKQLTVKYAFLQGTFWMSECSICSFAAVYLKSREFTNVQIGLVLALASILSILLQPLIASFADKSKKISLRSIVILIMIITMALGITLWVLPNSFYLVASSYVLINSLQYTLSPLFNSLAIEYINKGVPLNYGLARGLGSISFAVISSVLGVLVNRFGPNILLNIFLINYIFVIISAYSFKAELPQTAESEAFHSNTEEDRTAPIGIFQFFIKYKKYMLQLVGIAMLFYSSSLINTYLINIVENVGGNSTNMGISLSIAASLELPTMAAFIFLVKKIKCSTLVKISAFFFLIKVLLTWLAPNVPTVYIAMAFQMISFALFTPASVYYVNAVIGGKDKVKGQAMLGVASSGISGTAASITGGKLLDTVGVADMLLVGSIVTGIGLIIIFLTTENTGKFNLNDIR